MPAEPLRPLRTMTVLNLVLLSIQGWTGDTVNLFVFSGFANNANSAQMGGSFIGAYALNFLVLYYGK